MSARPSGHSLARCAFSSTARRRPSAPRRRERRSSPRRSRRSTSGPSSRCSPRSRPRPLPRDALDGRNCSVVDTFVDVGLSASRNQARTAVDPGWGIREQPTGRVASTRAHRPERPPPGPLRGPAKRQTGLPSRPIRMTPTGSRPEDRSKVDRPRRDRSGYDRRGARRSAALGLFLAPRRQRTAASLSPEAGRDGEHAGRPCRNFHGLAADRLR